MVAAFRASAVSGNGQSTTTSKLTITVPGTAASGDNASITVTSSSATATLAVPAGWSLQSGPDRVPSSSSGWLLTKTLAGSDPGAVVTLQFSGTSRCGAVMEVNSGTTTTGMQVATAVIETTSNNTPNLPTLASVPSGAYVSTSLARRFGGTPAPTFTLPAGWTAGPSSKSTYGSVPELSTFAGHQVTSSSGSVGGTQASATSNSVGVDYMVAWPVAAAGGSISTPAATAQVTASATAGTVTITIPPPAVYPPDPYRAAIRAGSLVITYTVDASRAGIPIVGATGMSPTGGSISDTTAPGVRRILNLELAPVPGLYDLITAYGTTLTVTAHIQYTDRSVFDLPMGVFDVDQKKSSEGGGGISITAPDKWIRVKRARFVGLGVSSVGRLVTDQIAQMIRDALGPAEPVNVTATSQAVIGAQTWDKDRDTAINGLAAGIGAWVYFDRTGVATVADLPTVGASADWLLDSSPSGVAITLDRQQDRTSTYNVVVVNSSAASGEAFPMQTVWDSDPTSPTYAGTTVPFASGTPFGIVPYFFDTPLPLSASGAAATGYSILARTVGLSSQVTLTATLNPAMDAFDVIDVLPPKQRYDIPRVLERHVVDTVTHPLDVTQSQQIAGRSTRSDPYT